VVAGRYCCIFGFRAQIAIAARPEQRGLWGRGKEQRTNRRRRWNSGAVRRDARRRAHGDDSHVDRRRSRAIATHSTPSAAARKLMSRSRVSLADLSSLKARYDAAAAAYREISTRNVRQALKGLRPSDDDFQLEDVAQEELTSARRAYLGSLRVAAKH
jgi:hypothetical protein